MGWSLHSSQRQPERIQKRLPHRRHPFRDEHASWRWRQQLVGLLIRFTSQEVIEMWSPLRKGDHFIWGARSVAVRLTLTDLQYTRAWTNHRAKERAVLSGPP